jgi:hypothetical protein
LNPTELAATRNIPVPFAMSVNDIRKPKPEVTVKHQFISAVLLLSVFSASSAVEIDLQSGTFAPLVTTTGPQSFRILNAGVGDQDYWADFSWRADANIFAIDEYGIAGQGSEMSSAPRNGEDMNPVEVDLSDARVWIWGPQLLRFQNALVAGQPYWAEFYWDSTDNVFRLDTFGSGEPSGCETRKECQLQQLLGTWEMKYTSGTPQTKIYHLTEFHKHTSDSFVTGEARNGDLVIASQWLDLPPTYGREWTFSLHQSNDNGTTNRFRFNFVRHSEIAGCHYRPNESGDSECQEMTGRKIAPASASWPFGKLSY